MNANELADYLDNNVEAMIMSEQPYIDQTATMLRQQQEKLTRYELRHVAQRDRIAILEMQHKQQQAEIELLKQIIDANNLSQKIGQFRKALTDEEDTECQYCKQGCIRCDARKTLTDEEIEQVGKETMLLQFFQSIEATADHGDSVARAMTAMIRQQAFDFARAILRKAQEL